MHVSGDAAFKTKLDKASREKAHEELNEVEKDRLGAVQSFRNLVLQERWLRTPTGILCIHSRTISISILKSPVRTIRPVNIS